MTWAFVPETKKARWQCGTTAWTESPFCTFCREFVARPGVGRLASEERIAAASAIDFGVSFGALFATRSRVVQILRTAMVSLQRQLRR
jgi:hypothetical protein